MLVERSASIVGQSSPLTGLMVVGRWRLTDNTSVLASATITKKWNSTMKIGKCPKCKEVKELTRHHIYPRRFFCGRSEVVLICRKCHDLLERKIPEKKKLPEQFYELVVHNFLQVWKATTSVRPAKKHSRRLGFTLPLLEQKLLCLSNSAPAVAKPSSSSLKSQELNWLVRGAFSPFFLVFVCVLCYSFYTHCKDFYNMLYSNYYK